MLFHYIWLKVYRVERLTKHWLSLPTHIFTQLISSPFLPTGVPSVFSTHLSSSATYFLWSRSFPSHALSSSFLLTLTVQFVWIAVCCQDWSHSVSEELAVGHPDVTALRTEEVLQQFNPLNPEITPLWASLLCFTISYRGSNFHCFLCLDLFLTAWLLAWGLCPLFRPICWPKPDEGCHD